MPLSRSICSIYTLTLGRSWLRPGASSSVVFPEASCLMTQMSLKLSHSQHMGSVGSRVGTLRGQKWEGDRLVFVTVGISVCAHSSSRTLAHRHARFTMVHSHTDPRVL